MLAVQSQSPPLESIASGLYESALRAIGAALCDPEESRSDNLLMSVMILMLYEV